MPRARPGITDYRYDANGNLTLLTDAKGNTTTYAYDDVNQLTRLTYADGSHEDYAYDAASHLISRTTPSNQPITYAYDALGRLTTKTTPEQTTSYGYDAGSRLLSAVDSGSILTFVYDARNQVTQARTLAPGLIAILNYAYDAAGHRTQLTDHQGAVLTSTYDALNRLTQLTEGATPVATVTYDALSRRADLVLANGTTTIYQYTATNQLQYLRTTNASQALLQELLYQYDANSQCRLMVERASLHLYTYDARSQLTDINYPTGFPVPDTSLTYDPLGNRTQVASTTTTPYTPTALNQYAVVGTTNLSYDANGNLTNDGARAYTYDSENHLTQATGPFGTVSHLYDPLGRRLRTTRNGVLTWFLLDGDQLLAELDANRVTTATYVYGPGLDEPLRMTRGGVSTYYHADALGSPVTLTDASGQIIERLRYDVFGQPFLTEAANTPLAQSSVGNRFGFTGREYDQETGLYDYRRRYYDPRLGRFLSRDPLGYGPDVNLYRYVGNDPLNWVDPWGLEKKRGGYPNDPLSGISGQNGGEFYLAIGIGGTIGGSLAPFILPSAFIGSAANVGVTSTGRLFVQVQASGLAGWGIFGGVGPQLTTGYSPTPIPTRITVTNALQIQGNVGAGPSFGGSVDLGPDGVSLSGGVGRSGFGLGLMFGGGVSTTSTRAWPSILDLLEGQAQ